MLVARTSSYVVFRVSCLFNLFNLFNLTISIVSIAVPVSPFSDTYLGVYFFSYAFISVSINISKTTCLQMPSPSEYCSLTYYLSGMWIRIWLWVLSFLDVTSRIAIFHISFSIMPSRCIVFFTVCPLVSCSFPPSHLPHSWNLSLLWRDCLFGTVRRVCTKVKCWRRRAIP